MPRRLGWAVAAAAMAAGVALPASAGAATFEPNRLGDRAPGPCRPADCTLREAVIAANASAGRDRILLRPGKRYRLRRAGTDNTALAGDLDITDRVVIRTRGGGPRAQIDANRIDRVIHVPAASAATRLARLVIRRGQATDAGGILAESRLVIAGSLVAGNRGPGTAGIAGERSLSIHRSQVRNNIGGTIGGVEARSAAQPASIVDSVLARNVGSTTGGAALEGPAAIRRSEISRNPGRPGPAVLGGGLVLDGPTRIDRTTVAGNRGSTHGGIDAESLGGTERLVVVRSRIERNRAIQAGFGDGGGIGAYARLRVARTKVLGNRAGGEGGGIANRGTRTVIVSSTVRGNRAEQPGGGAYLSDTLDPHRATIRGSTFRGNRALDDGGGISFVAGHASALGVVNSTIALNRADQNGGGLELRGGTVNLNAATVARNRANAAASGSRGGGIAQGTASGTGAAVVVANSLLALNLVGADGSGPQCSGTYTSGGGNLITARPGCTDLDGPFDLVRANPRIGVIGAHGGPTQTIPLRRRSPAINAARGTAPPRDQRGVPRGAPDSGAFERR